ncbi:ribosomal protein L11 methyltransferase-domain-containing protein [Pelagophyceae sp. CCMP2097]|nr:ribosomal protein L11 methyltransferase-domain-containing protein [Pelagophyceae sp. CCMP2097]
MSVPRLVALLAGCSVRHAGALTAKAGALTARAGGVAPRRGAVRRASGGVDFGEVSLVCGGGTIEADELAELLMEIGALSVGATNEDEGGADEGPVFREPGDSASGPRAWRRTRIRALVDRGGEASLVAALGDIYGAAEIAALAPEFGDVLDRDWLREQEAMRPVIFIGKMRVILPWHESDPAAEVELLIEGGAAFGTGEHPTTRMCCEWLQSNNLAGRRVMDYGCGSGILALAALKFGAAAAAGVDIDPQAVEAAVRNAEVNGLAAAFYLPAASAADSAGAAAYAAPRQHDCAALPDAEAPFDFVVANILLNPLRWLRPTICNLVATGGALAISGVREDQAADVVALYGPAFRQARVADQRDGWALVVLTDRTDARIE